MQGTICQKCIKFTVPKNTTSDAHKTRTPLFPNMKHQKIDNSLKKYFFLFFFSGQNSHGAIKPLRSPSAFFRPKTFTKREVGTFRPSEN